MSKRMHVAEPEWEGMPEFVQEKQRPYQVIIMRFANQEDVDDFAKAINQPITPKTKSLWHPQLVKGVYKDTRWVDEQS